MDNAEADICQSMAGHVAECEEVAGANDTLSLARCSGGFKNTDMEPWNPTWPELCDELSKASVGDKDGPYYVRGACSTPRGDESMPAGATLLIIDGDKSVDPASGEIVDKCVPPEDAHEALRSMGIPHLLHTSYSHDPAKGINKWRAIIECPMQTRGELHAMSNWIIDQLNERGVPIIWVKEMSAMSQPWFFPRLRSDDIQLYVVRYDLEEGEEHHLSQKVVERVTAEWKAKGSTIEAGAERGSERDGKSPIGRFLKKFDNADFITGLLEEHAGCSLVGSDVVNGKVAYRLVPPDSTTGAAGVHVYRGKNDGTWLVFSHNASFEMPMKAMDAFGVFQWLVHNNDQTAALADAKRMVAEADGELSYDTASELIETSIEIESERDRANALKDLAKQISASSLIDNADQGALLKRIAKHAGFSVADLRKDVKKAAPSKGAKAEFILNEEDKIVGNAFNNSAAVRRKEIIGAEVAYDTFRERIVVRKAGEPEWSNFQDHMFHDIQSCLDQFGFDRNSVSLVKGAVKAIARENEFDSHRDWIESLSWDGKARVDAFCEVYFGSAKDEYSKAVGRYIWSALAARAVLRNQAGEKADMVTILAGGQGVKKSTLLSQMAPDDNLFVELDLNEPKAELVRKQRGRVIWELGELTGMSQRCSRGLKFLFSMKSDAHRDNYAEFSEDRPRRGLYFGTTNEDQFLDDDPSGHRRYLPLQVGVRLSEGEKLPTLSAHDRDQLWAEGLAIFKKTGIAFEKAETLAKKRHDAHIDLDPWHSVVEEWLAQKSDTSKGGPPNADLLCLTTRYIANNALFVETSKLDKAIGNRVGKIMRRLGYRLARGVVVSKHEKDNAWRRETDLSVGLEDIV